MLNRITEDAVSDTTKDHSSNQIANNDHCFYFRSHQ